MDRSSRAGLGAVLLLAGLGLSGCFLMSLGRDAEPVVSGPAPYVEGCQTCHASPVVAQYAQSVHSAKGIRCGQCHTPGGHPDFTQPVADAKCGGCHLAQYEQTVASKHFAVRDQRSLDRERAARTALRRERFTAPAPTGRRFVGDATAGDLGGRLCVACHYDEHRLGRADVRQAAFCVGCHPAGPDTHFSAPTPGEVNPCLACHVQDGSTASGQAVNTHRFAKPGSGS
jgi:hypothetical protein